MRAIPLMAAASALAFATPVLAQDATAADPMAAPADAPAPYVAEPTALPEDQPFSGLYVGVAGGYDAVNNKTPSGLKFDRNQDGKFGDPVVTAAGAPAFIAQCPGQARTGVAAYGCNSDKDNGAVYGRIGFDKQYGPFVVGALGEFGTSWIRDYTSAFSSTPASYVFKRDLTWEAGARLRAGFAANRTLFYATGGAGYAKIGHRFATTNGVNAFNTRGRREQWGLQAGGGIEQKIGRNFSIGLEYLYHSYVDNDFTVRATAGTAGATNPFILAPNTSGTDIRRSDEVFRWHSMRATAAFRF